MYRILILSVLSVTLLVTRSTAKDDDKEAGPCSHNFFDGTVQPYDRLLNRTEVASPKKTTFGFPVKRIEEVRFPPLGTSSTAIISAVRVFDMVVNGTGGFVDRVTYGPTRQSATLRLKSQRGEGYRFLCEVWGH